LNAVARFSEPDLKYFVVVRVQNPAIKVSYYLSLRDGFLLTGLIHLAEHPLENFRVHLLDLLNLVSQIQVEISPELLFKLLARNIVQHLVDCRLRRVPSSEL